MAGKIYKAGMSLLVIDTENKFVSTGFAKEIARIAQGIVTESTFSSNFDMLTFLKEFQFLLQENTITCLMPLML